MAGTVTRTEETHLSLSVKKIKFDWLSSAGGAADDATTRKFTGVLERAVFVPDSGGTQPTNLYDVVVNDDDGNDVLMGQGANLSNAATVQALASVLGVFTQSKLTLAVTNGGAAKGGIVYLYFRGEVND